MKKIIFYDKHALFEIRVTHEGIFRGLYAYVMRDLIIMLHFFKKKTQKTPSRSIAIAQKRFKMYE